MRQNPFTFGTMITEPDKFIGRRHELNLICTRLNGDQPQGSAIVGPRRIGKSSLLHYLYKPRVDEPLQPNDKCRVIFWDVSEGDCYTPAQFRTQLLDKLHQLDDASLDVSLLGRVRETLSRNPLDTSWAGLRDTLEALGWHPVVCLDEFEALLKRGFEDRFFSALRSWANAGLISWVTASAQRLDVLADNKGMTSPFFNLLATIELGELTDEEVLELLERTNVDGMMMSAREQKQIQHWTGNNPYHLQIAAFRWWEMKRTGRVKFKEIWQFLCQQPSPPARCGQSTDSRWPDWLTKPWQKIKQLWGMLDSFGGGFGGLILVGLLIAAAAALFLGHNDAAKAFTCTATGLLCP